MKKTRILQLEGIRFIMCCIIILSHFEFLEKSQYFGQFYLMHLHNPGLAVDYFFMLSGFGMYLSTKRPSFTLFDASKFAKNKVKKIYPAYILSLLIGVPYTIFIFLQYSSLGKSILKTIFYFGLDLTLLQSIFGISKFTHAINGVAWFLSSLFICYCFSPLLLKFIDSIKSLRQIIYSILLTFIYIFLLTGFYIWINNISFGIFNQLWYSHPSLRIAYVWLGMCIGFIYRKFKFYFGTTSELIIIITFILYFYWGNAIFIDVNIKSFFDSVFCFIFIFVFSNGNGKVTEFFKASVLVYLGNISMYLFLFHYPIRMNISTLFAKYNLYSRLGEESFIIEILLILIITFLVVSIFILVQKSVEKIVKMR